MTTFCSFAAAVRTTACACFSTTFLEGSLHVTIEPLTIPTQTNKKGKNSSDICLSFSRYTSNILKVNFDELRV